MTVQHALKCKYFSPRDISAPLCDAEICGKKIRISKTYQRHIVSPLMSAVHARQIWFCDRSRLYRVFVGNARGLIWDRCRPSPSLAFRCRLVDRLRGPQNLRTAPTLCRLRRNITGEPLPAQRDGAALPPETRDRQPCAQTGNKCSRTVLSLLPV